MKGHHCTFVLSSEVFKGCTLAQEVFNESDPNCCWGSNNRSLVTPNVIRDALDAATTTTAQAKQVKKVIKRLDSLGQTYIDLEN